MSSATLRRAASDLNWIRSQSPPSRRLLAVSILLGAGAVLAAAGLLTTSGYLISRAAQQPEILTLSLAIVGVRFFGLARALLRYSERLVTHDFALRGLGELRRRLYVAIVPLVPAGIGEHRGGDLLSRFVADVDRMQDLWLRALLPPAIALAAAIGAVAIAWIVLPAAGIALAAAFVFGGVIVPAVTRLTAARALRAQSEARAALSTDLLEIAQGAPEIALAGREAEWIGRAERSGERLTSIQRRDAFAGALGGGLAAALATATALAMTALALDATAEGELSGVMIAAVALLGLGALEAVTPLPAAAGAIDSCAAAAGRIRSIVDRPGADPTPESQAAPGVDSVLVRADLELQAREGLRLVNAGFGFGGRPVLAGASLILDPGELVALRGPSGIGKTTVAEILSGFRELDRGSLSLGELDVAEIGGGMLREQVALIGQDAYVFDLSVRENLMLADPDASTERLIGALRRVGLGEWLRGLPEGIDSRLGEGARAVSGGERRRIALARALLSHATFLILDEPTAQLDEITADRILAELRAEADGGRGVLVITHDLPRDGRTFDRQITLRDGILEAEGI